MDIHTFMTNYREAFGERAELPIAFWYSDKQESETDKIGGCFFKGLQQVREGKTISLNSRRHRMWRRKVLHRFHGNADTRT